MFLIEVRDSPHGIFGSWARWNRARPRFQSSWETAVVVAAAAAAAAAVVVVVVVVVVVAVVADAGGAVGRQRAATGPAAALAAVAAAAGPSPYQRCLVSSQAAGGFHDFSRASDCACEWYLLREWARPAE